MKMNIKLDRLKDFFNYKKVEEQKIAELQKTVSILESDIQNITNNYLSEICDLKEKINTVNADYRNLYFSKCELLNEKLVLKQQIATLRATVKSLSWTLVIILSIYVLLIFTVILK